MCGHLASHARADTHESAGVLLFTFQVLMSTKR